MFIYLPLWFSLGAIFYLSLRVVTARVGGSLNGPTLAVLSAIALLALVLASVLQPVARVGLALAALAVGAVAASLLWGQPPKSDSGPVKRDGDAGKFADVLRKLIGPEGQAPLEREKLDIGRALIVGAAALFLAFAALQYDYDLVRQISKLSAGGVDLEFSESQKGDRSPVIYSQLPADSTKGALPRTNGLSYVTSKLKELGEDVVKDNRIAAMLSNTYPSSPPDQEFRSYGCGILRRLASELSRIQKDYKSEFPTLGDIDEISWRLRKVYQEALLIEGSKDDARLREYEGQLLRVLYAKNSIQGHSLQEQMDDLISQADDDYNILVENDKPGEPEPTLCKDASYATNFATAIQASTLSIHNHQGNSFGYLAALTAFAEFANGNQESAIRLLDERIATEIVYVKALSSGKTDEMSRYNVIRKESMITRLIVYETGLAFVAKANDQFDRMLFGRWLDGVYLTSDIISSFQAEDGVRAKKLIESPRSLITKTVGDELNEIDPCGNYLANYSNPDDKKMLAQMLYYRYLFKNNSVSLAGTNQKIVLWADASGLPNQSSGLSDLSQKLLIDKLDKWARVVYVASDRLKCFTTQAALRVAKASDYKDSVGGYFQMKGRNFLDYSENSVLPRSDYGGGPVEGNEQRIESSCKAIVAFQGAEADLEREAKEDDIYGPSSQNDTIEIDRILAIQDFLNTKDHLAIEGKTTREYLRKTYLPTQIDSYCTGSL